MTDKFDETPIDLYQGDDETYTFNVTSNGVAFDISTYTIKCVARESADSATEIFNIDLNPGEAGADWANGIVVLVVPSAISVLMTKSVLYDLEATSAGAAKTTLCRGPIRVVKHLSS